MSLVGLEVCAVVLVTPAPRRSARGGNVLNSSRRINLPILNAGTVLRRVGQCRARWRKRSRVTQSPGGG